MRKIIEYCFHSTLLTFHSFLPFSVSSPSFSSLSHSLSSVLWIVVPSLLSSSSYSHFPLCQFFLSFQHTSNYFIFFPLFTCLILPPPSHLFPCNVFLHFLSCCVFYLFNSLCAFSFFLFVYFSSHFVCSFLE